MNFIGTEYARFCARLERELEGLASAEASLLLARRAWSLVRESDSMKAGLLDAPVAVGDATWGARLEDLVAEDGRYADDDIEEVALRLMAATRAALLCEPQWNLGEAVVYAKRFAPYWCPESGPLAVAMWDGYVAYRGHGSYAIYAETMERQPKRPDIFRERPVEPGEVSIEEGASLIAWMLQGEMATVPDVEHVLRARRSYDTFAGAGPMAMPWEEEDLAPELALPLAA